MSAYEEPRLTARPPDPELESTDGGWDPYVTSLLMSGAQHDDAESDSETESEPVRSFSRTQEKRGR